MTRFLPDSSYPNGRCWLNGRSYFPTGGKSVCLPGSKNLGKAGLPE